MICVFILIILFVVILVRISMESKGKNNRSYYPAYRDRDFDEDDLEEELMFQEMRQEEYDEHCASHFAYPDPSEMKPEDLMYLDDDGELLEDL